MGSFLTIISTVAQSDSSVPESNLANVTNSVVAYILKELRSILIFDDISNLFRQGQDITVRLSSIRSKLQLHKGQILQGQLTDI